MTYFGEIGEYRKAEKPISSPKHYRWVRTLPCLVSQVTDSIEGHHCLRVPTRFGSRKSGDQWLIPLHSDLHRALHDDWGDEQAFMAHWGIPGYVQAAQHLWENTGDVNAYLRAVEIARQGNG